jgi:hypothetical protein
MHAMDALIGQSATTRIDIRYAQRLGRCTVRKAFRNVASPTHRGEQRSHLDGVDSCREWVATRMADKTQWPLLQAIEAEVFACHCREGFTEARS